MKNFLECKHTNVQQFTDYCLDCGWNVWTTEAEYRQKTGDNKIPIVSKYDIPFDSEGNQLHYGESWRKREANYAFFDTITFVEFQRGRSAAYAVFKRSTGTTVTVFLTDLEDMLPRMSSGKINSKFEFCKRGNNFGVKLSATKKK